MNKDDPRHEPTDEELEGMNDNWTDAATAEPETDVDAGTAEANKVEPTPPAAPTTAPEIKHAAVVPGLIKSTESTKRPADETAAKPAWGEEDDDDDEEPDGQYDPHRGDRVDVLNDTTPPPRPVAVPKKGKKKRWPIILIILVLLLAGGAAYYFLLGNKKAAAPAKTQSTATTQKPTTATPKTTTPTTITTKHYDSTNYALGLDYPDTWKLNDTEIKLTITSPQVSLKTADGKQTSGYIQLSVQNKQTSLPEFAKGPAVAVLDSEKITYKKPTPNQRAATYLTFASYSTTTGNGWDALYVTGDNGYQVGQTIPMSDIIQTDPLVQVRFLACTDQTCSGTPTALTLDATEWKNTAVSAPIKTIIQSFSFN